MFKKLLGGVLLCVLVVPISIVLSVTDGVSLILECVSRGVKMMLKPLMYKIMKLLATKTKENYSHEKNIYKSYNVMIES